MDKEIDVSVGLKWTGQPVYDAGLAALVVFSKKTKPEELTNDDFEEFAKYARKVYVDSADIISSIAVLFTMNRFLNPSFKEDTKKEKIAEILNFNRPIREDLPYCTYTNQPSVEIAARDSIPMLTGRDAVNFSPYGQTGLPVSGHTLVILQALTLAALRSQGKAVIVAADDPELTLQIIGKWQPEIKTRIQLAEIKGEAIRSPQTRVIKVLTELEDKRGNTEEGNTDTSSAITVYHLSNSGQSPSINIFFLPASITYFVRAAQISRFRPAWDSIVRLSWDKPRPKGNIPAVNEGVYEEEQRSLKNRFYEDLFELPKIAPKFIRRYFKAHTNRIRKSGQGAIGAKRVEIDELLASMWKLTELFLLEVLNMEKERVAAIRKLGEVLAEEVVEENDKKLFTKLTIQVRSYAELRNQLIRFNLRRLKNNKKPEPDFDNFLLIFEEGEELAKVDWKIAWDLTQIRFIDELYGRRWFDKNPEVLDGFEDADNKEDED